MWKRVTQRSRALLKRHVQLQLRKPQLFLRLRRRFSSSTPPTSPASKAATAAASNASKATSQAAAKLPSSYAPGIVALHWLTGGTILGCFAFVELAKRTPKGDPRRVELMKYHKSLGLLAMGLVTARVLRRFAFIDRLKHLPGPLPGVPKPMHLAGDATHYLLYGAMIFMPASGIIMGYYGGKGLPFFNWHIPGRAEPNKAVAGTMFKYHKLGGKAMEILVGLHVSAALFHHVSGHGIFGRITSLGFGGAIAGMEMESIEDDANDAVIRSNYEDLLCTRGDAKDNWTKDMNRDTQLVKDNRERKED